MAKKQAKSSKQRKKKADDSSGAWWRWILAPSTWRVAGRLSVVLLGLAALGSVGWGVQQLEMRVDEELAVKGPGSLRFVDLPQVLVPLADADLRAQLLPLLDGPWLDDDMCRSLAERLAEIGWVAEVHYVRRTPAAEFVISCQYRVPVALVQQGTDFYLVDEAGVRLPGVYRYDPAWPLVQGVALPAPDAGFRWPGPDLQAGLKLIEILRRERFAEQITAVLVDNFAGREDRRRAHLELSTDRAGGRIRWGSAPGAEIEENTIVQKLALLRGNFERTGRADGGHAVIDVSVFPDRFLVVEGP
jgi:hypothetical protein